MFYIILPVYDVGYDFLWECLDSIFRNRINLIKKVIIINDDSNKWELEKKAIDCFKNNKLIILENKKNIGLGPSRNKGLLFIKKNFKIEKKDYILFIDSDDFIHEKMLRKLNFFLNFFSFPNILRFGYFAINENNFEIFPNFFLTKNDQYYNVYEMSWASIYNAYWLINSNILFLNVKMPHEDVYFFLVTSIQAVTICSIPHPLYYYRTNRVGSITYNWNNLKYSLNEQKSYLSHILFYFTSIVENSKKLDGYCLERERFYFQKFNWILSTDRILNINFNIVKNDYFMIEDIFKKLNISYMLKGWKKVNSEKEIKNKVYFLKIKTIYVKFIKNIFMHTQKNK